MFTPTPSRTRFSRRAVVGSGIAGAAAFPLARFAPVSDTFGPHPAAAAPAEQDAAAPLARWKMWFLTASDALRPPAPGAPAADEIEEVIGYLDSPSDEMAAAIARWGTQPATIPWTEAANAACNEFRVNGMRLARNLALVHTAMHDAAVAAWNAQLAYDRPSPAASDDRITPTGGGDPALPSIPSLHAAVAAAASAVLTYLHPEAEPGRFDDLAQEAAKSRVWAGAALPSDVEAGLALGRAVGERAVARGRGDGSDAAFDPSAMPSGPGYWRPTAPAFADPVEPMGGAWQCWIMERGDQFRPAPFPEYDSPEWRSELDAVREIVRARTLAQKSDAVWWQGAAYQIFFDWTNELLVRHGIDTPPAARVLAYQAVSMADAIIAVWDAKYTWWTSRPINDDPEIVTAFPTPAYPEYPSGYSAIVSATAQMVGLFFPDAAEQLDELAWRAVRSRAWAGIHYPLANEVGMIIGRRVARLAALRAAEEGAFPA
jgi:hypothetical protein